MLYFEIAPKKTSLLEQCFMVFEHTVYILQLEITKHFKLSSSVKVRFFFIVSKSFRE